MFRRIGATIGGDLRVERKHRTGLLKLAYVVAIVAAADVSTDGTFGTYLPGNDGWVVFADLSVTVPEYIYLYAFAGAGAYALTSLIFDPKESATELLALGYRLVAALPLGAGVYLLAAFVVGVSLSDGNVEVTQQRLLAGTAFVAGLFVKLTLRKLGDVAERIYDLDGEADASLPYEQSRRRNEAHANLRRCYSELLDGIAADETGGNGTDEAELRGRLRQVEAILDDDDATLQELERAVALSEEALGAMDGDGATEAGSQERQNGRPDGSDGGVDTDAPEAGVNDGTTDAEEASADNREAASGDGGAASGTNGDEAGSGDRVPQD